MTTNSVAGLPVPDPRWTIRQSVARPQTCDAAVFTVGAGGFATRDAAIDSGDSTPGVLATGVYAGSGPNQQLLEGPVWTRFDIDPVPVGIEVELDMYNGVLRHRDTLGGTGFEALRFACSHRPGVQAMRIVPGTGTVRPGPPLQAPAPDPDSHTCVSVPLETPDGIWRMRVESEVGVIEAAATQHLARNRLDRVVVLAAGASEAGPPVARLRGMRDSRGLDRLLEDHRATWARRWSDVGIELPGDPETELAVRFALFQLWSNADAHGRSAVGARGLSGTGYRGHVFWDTEVFVLPAMVSIDPEAAAAMLAYRLDRLAPALARAETAGRRGARFPWESAADGTDVTPRTGFLGNAPVDILTGQLEEHITADVAWAADHYAEWTGDDSYTDTTGRPLLVETARYWASRVRVDTDGRAHLEGVIGPDEYHEWVDDNAFTNVMARWNLRRAARLRPENDLEAAEFASWRALAERLVDQLGPDGCYEQFRGYFELEPLTAAQVGRPPVAADVLLGHERIAASQVIKQPDVLMLHHLIPDEVAAGSLPANLGCYGPRTAHGSSLSPAVTAALTARAGRPDDALTMLRIALRLDLDDRTATTAAGLHLATLGGVWQAMLAGFAGVSVRAGVLRIDPHLPSCWPALGLRFRCLGRRIGLHIDHTEIRVRTDGPLTVAAGTGDPIRISGEYVWPAS